MAGEAQLRALRAELQALAGWVQEGFAKAFFGP